MRQSIERRVSDLEARARHGGRVVNGWLDYGKTPDEVVAEMKAEGRITDHDTVNLYCWQEPQ